MNRHSFIPVLALALLALQARVGAAQEYDGNDQPPPDPDSWEINLPTTPTPVDAPPPPPRQVSYSGLRNQAEISPTDLEFLESIVLDALIPLGAKGFHITPDDHASKFCDDACTLGLASQAGREFLIHGEVSTYAGGYMVSLRLHRVADSQLLHTAMTDSRPLLGELVSPTTDAAAKLALALETAPPPPPPAPPPPPLQPVAPPPQPVSDPALWWPTEETGKQPADDEDDEDGFPFPTRGIELEIRGGLNFCAEAGDATCSNYEMGGGGAVFIGARIVPVFAAGFDFGLYGLKLKDTAGKSDVRVSTRHFMLAPRLYLPFRVVELHLELGFLYHGYYEQGEIDGTDYQIRISSWTTFRLGAGTTFYLVRGARVGDIGLGLDLQYNFFAPKDVELCGDPVIEGHDCDEVSWGTYVSMLEDELEQATDTRVDLTNDMVDFFQFSFHLTWLIPVF